MKTLPFLFLIAVGSLILLATCANPTASSNANSTSSTSTTTNTPTGTSSSFTIYAVGDSTMADYDTTTYPNQRGWGQMFPQFITNNQISFVNGAKNGRSSRSFYLDPAAYWSNVKSKLKAGDYVLIQFGHNDEVADGLDTTTDAAGEYGRGTQAWDSYPAALTKYIDETQAAGAIPILVTPVVRLSFSGSTLTATSKHDLTGNGVIPADKSGDYPQAMRNLATARSVTLIDMTASTKTLVESLGATNAKSLLYITTDNTHLSPMGATMFAQLAVQEMINKGLFSGSLNPAVDLVVSPTTASFGDRYVGTTLDKTFLATGLSLSPDTGNVTVTAPAGFTVSATAAGTFTNSIQIAYSGGKLAPTNFYVRFSPVAVQAYSGTISVSPDSGTTKTIAVTGNGLAVSGSAIESSVTWSLTSSLSPTATVGLVTGADEVQSNLYVKNYQTVATWDTASADTLTQRNSITGDAWPTETDISASRYIQFSVTPTAGKTFVADSISFYAGGAGGNNMAYRVLYSTNADFSGETVLGESLTNTTNTMYLKTFTNVITVPDGQTLYVRIYPWLKSAGSSKYLCLQNFKIHGNAQ